MARLASSLSLIPIDPKVNPKTYSVLQMFVKVSQFRFGAFTYLPEQMGHRICHWNERL